MFRPKLAITRGLFPEPSEMTSPTGRQPRQRYGELHGNELAATITLQAFLALFPLALVALAVVGFLAAGSGDDLAGRITEQLGLTGQAAVAVSDAIAAAQRNRQAASAVGLLGLLWSGLGLARLPGTHQDEATRLGRVE